MRICFVCLGNICRSPTAEAVALKLIVEDGLEFSVGSAGTGAWHVGNPPDPRMQEAARTRGYDMSALRAEQVKASDLDRYDLFIAMDKSNARNLHQILGQGNSERIDLLLNHHDGPEIEVPDPYYGGREGFSNVIDLVESGVTGLFNHLRLSGKS